MTGLFIGAGGLGLSGSAGIIALHWLPFLILPAYRRLKAQPTGLILGAMAIAWTAASLSWSPYDRPDQAVKLVLLTPLYVLLPFAITLLQPNRVQRFAHFFAIIILMCATFFLVEGLFGAPISIDFKMRFEGVGTLQEAEPLAVKALSRGASGFLLIGGPVAIWLWMKAGRWRWASAYLIMSLVFAASAFDVEANIIALAAGILVGAFGYFWSAQRTFQILLCATALWILSAPITMTVLLLIFPDALAETMPLSWQMRLEIWDRAVSFISQAPVFGHGLDASRVLNARASIDDVTFDALPLHPHNLGLHIWLETGAMGAGLFAMTLVGIALSIGRSPTSRITLIGLSYCFAAWIVMVMLGFGIWQEWHHGALSLAITAVMFSARSQAENS